MVTETLPKRTIRYQLRAPSQNDELTKPLSSKVDEVDTDEYIIVRH